MRKHNSKHLALDTQTIRSLQDVSLGAVAGGHIQTRGGCTKKNSECSKCPVNQQ